MAEMKDKEYLQECLDETGNILFQLKNNEKKLQDDREILLDDLEQEQEVRTYFLFHCANSYHCFARNSICCFRLSPRSSVLNIGCHV